MRAAVLVALVVSALQSACKSPAPPAPTPAEAAAPASPSITLKDLQGKWKIVSSTGEPDKGHAFREMIGEVLVVDGDVLSVPAHARDVSGAPTTFQMTKKITLLPGTNPQAIHLDQTPDAQGWSRVGVVMVAGDVMTLSVIFPQLARPADLKPASDGREVVTLERVK